MATSTGVDLASNISVIIVDDEPLARRLIAESLKLFGGVEIVSECANGREAIMAIQTLKPDLMFLDIQMPGLGGFDVIRSVNSDILPAIIFVTAYDAFAIDAFDVNAIDYLLKPISEERFSRALERALDRLRQGQASHADKKSLFGALNVVADRVREKTKNKAQAAVRLMSWKVEKYRLRMVIRLCSLQKATLIGWMLPEITCVFMSVVRRMLFARRCTNY